MTTTVYLNDIQMNFNVIDVLTGACNIYIENPWFKPPPGLTPMDEKNFFKVKPASPTKLGEHTGTYYSTPKIHFRKNTNDNYTNYTNLILLPSKASKSTIFRISKPYQLTDEKKKSSNQVLGVTFADKDIAERIMRLDQRLTIVADVMLSAKLLGLNLAPLEKCKDNNECFAGLNQMIADATKAWSTKSKKKFNKTIAYEPEYINFWNVFPVWCSKELKSYCYTKEVFEAHVDEIDDAPDAFAIKGVFAQLISKMTMPGFTTANSNLKPMNNVKISKKKETEEIKIYNATQLRFKIKTPNSKIPDTLLTQKIIKKTGKLLYEPITPTSFLQLWGGDNYNGASYEGFIIANINFDVSIYPQGASYIKWDARQCKMRFSSGAGAQVDINEMPDMSDSDDGDDDEELPPVTSKKPLKKGATEGTIDLGNENEDDDDI